MINPIALQLYTIRKIAEKDFAEALRMVPRIGYGAVEFAGYFGLDSRAISALLNETGLAVAGSHLQLHEIESNVQSECAFCRDIGCRYIVIPAIPPQFRTGTDGFAEAGKRLGSLASQCEQLGVSLCYHTHGFDFEEMDGMPALEHLLNAASTDSLLLEIDTFWAAKAGKHIVELLRKYAGRCKLLHLKDMPEEAGDRDTETGAGVIDFYEVVAGAEAFGVEWLIVEQEQCARPAEECARKSFRNLQKMGLA
jgi:sugar phosphate isomerase/epimerase